MPRSSRKRLFAICERGRNRLLPKAAAGWHIVSFPSASSGRAPTWLSRPLTAGTGQQLQGFFFHPTQSLTVVSALPASSPQKSADGIEIGKAASGPFLFSPHLTFATVVVYNLYCGVGQVVWKHAAEGKHPPLIWWCATNAMWLLLWASTMRKHMKRKQSDAVSFSVSCSSWSISWARPCKVRACGTLMDALSTSIPPSWLDLNGIILLSLIWCSFVTDWNFVWAPLVLLVMCSCWIYSIQESWL